MSKKTSCKVILAGTIAESLTTEISEGLTLLNRKPLLVGFLANADPAARKYAEWTSHTSRERGFHFELRELDRGDLEDSIIAANYDDVVDGIIVYYPVFGNRQDQYLQQIVSPTKDVEGLCHKHVFNMYQNIRFQDEKRLQKSVLPCTPLAIVKILEHLHVYNIVLPYGNRLFGRSITIVNRSEVVGRPLAALLANDGASVYSVDITGVQHFTRGEGIKKQQHEVIEKTGWTIEDCAPQSDVVICGVPNPSFKFPTRLLRNGAICINFSSEKNFEPDIKESASIYVPAVGKSIVRNKERSVAQAGQSNEQTTKDASIEEEIAAKAE